uniref:Maturation protein n=1 Tax=Mella virus TaxID=2707242 RepID=A0A6H0DHF0_9VIRU|nr:MAG: maturation protein [Mella virus]
MSKDIENPADSIPDPLKVLAPPIRLTTQKRKRADGSEYIVRVPTHTVRKAVYKDAVNWELDIAEKRFNDPVHQVKPAPYYRKRQKVSGFRNYSEKRDLYTVIGGLSVERDAYTRAYDDFLDELQSDQGQLGMTLATMRQSMGMVGDYSYRILKSLQAVRRKDFVTAAKVLSNPRLAAKMRRYGQRYPRKRGEKYYLKDYGGEYLAYTYGISPLISEIEALKNLLAGNGSLLLGPTQGFGRADNQEDRSRTYRGGLIRRRDIRTQTHKVWLQANVILDDPKSAFLSSLGLHNPWIVINDLIPWSFVVNYWTGHEAWLHSLDAFAGIHLEDEMVSHKEYWRYDYENVDTSREPNRHIIFKAEAETFRRQIKPFKRPGLLDRVQKWPFSSQRRAMNMAALIGQQFKHL